VQGADGGSVRFVDGGFETPIGTARVVAGRAVLHVDTLGKGRHLIQAVYSGHGTLTHSISLTVVHDVTDGELPRRRAARH
jgi:hypothetical protein